MELTVAATEVTMAGESAERAAALAERAIEALRADPILAVVVGFAARCLTVADRLDEADRVLSATVDDARRQRANYRVGPLLAFRSDARFRAGALRDAVADAEAALAAYAHAGRLSVLGSTAALVQALAERGEFEAAEAALEAADAHGPPEAIGDAYTGTLVLNARARLRLAQGNARAALADLLEVGRRQEAMREPNPAAVDWRSQAALAYATLDQPDAALALAREELELARRFGAARAIGIALRTLGVIGDELDASRRGGGRAGGLTGPARARPRARRPRRRAPAPPPHRRGPRAAPPSARSRDPLRRHAARRARPDRAADRRRAAAPAAAQRRRRPHDQRAAGRRAGRRRDARTARSPRRST